MAHKDQKEADLLQRPLYIFDLPPELLHTLTLRSEIGASLQPSTPEPQATLNPITPENQISFDESPAKATSCSLCGLKSPTLEEQRNHVRSDLHKYNLKLKIRGSPVVNEEDFEKLIGELDESISGSESSASESEDDISKGEGGHGKDSTLTALLKKQAKISHPGDEVFSSNSRKHGIGKAPLVWFSSPALPENTALGVYRAIFSVAEQDEPLHLVDSLRRKQLASTSATKKADGGAASLANVGPHYFLCMIGGGHFAAMVVSLAPKVKKNHTGQREATVLAHKGFHRYTTRRKQGGSQSAHDAKGAASSAGASLRRYNETALIAEVRALLSEWKSLIDSADLLFIRATGNTNRQTLFGPYEGQVLRQQDARNRGFPFTTRRATQTELMRAFVELTRVKVSHINEAALAAAAAEREKEAAAAKTTVSPKAPKAPKFSEEEETAMLHTTQLQTLIRRSKAPALLSYIKSNAISPNFTFFPSSSNHHSPTPLHLASSLSSPAIVTALLVKGSADPSIRNEDGKTAFDIAGDRVTRDAFRLARHALGESAWDWDDACVPPALTPAEASKRGEQESAEKAAEDKKEAERRKAETERLRKESESEEVMQREKKMGKGRSLAGLLVEKSGAEKREVEARGMTPEMRMRLERERRARAAEERMRR